VAASKDSSRMAGPARPPTTKPLEPLAGQKRDQHSSAERPRGTAFPGLPVKGERVVNVPRPAPMSGEPAAGRALPAPGARATRMGLANASVLASDWRSSSRRRTHAEARSALGRGQHLERVGGAHASDGAPPSTHRRSATLSRGRDEAHGAAMFGQAGGGVGAPGRGHLNTG